MCSLYLMSNEDITAKIRYKSWIYAGVLIPFVLSPLMIRLWYVTGSGNANFLFFQGLIMWVFLGLGIIEYISTFKNHTSKG